MVRGRSGFTLLEVLMASAIATLVAASLATFFVGSRRLIRDSYVESQLSLKLREQRERILFQTMREGGNANWGGLLSALDVEVGKDRTRYTAVGIDASSGRGMERGNQNWTGAFEHSLAASHGIFYVTLSETIGEQTQSARVVVPMFGSVQRTDLDHLFFDDQLP